MQHFILGVIACLYSCCPQEVNADIFPQSDTLRLLDWGPTWVYITWKQPPSVLPLYTIQVDGNGTNTNHTTTDVHFNVTNLKAGETYNISVQTSPQYCNITGTSSPVSVLGSTSITTSRHKEVKIEVDRFYRRSDLDKYFIPVGRNIKVTCSLTSSAYDVKDVIIEPDGETFMEAHSKWRMYSVDSPRVVYIDCCLYKCGGNVKHQQKDTAVLHVGYPPGQVIDFFCYSHVLSNLICTWRVESDNKVLADWSVEYMISRVEVEAVSDNGQCDVIATDCFNWYCPCEVKQEEGHFRCEATTLLLYYFYPFRILGTNDYGTTTFTNSIFLNETIATYSRPYAVRVDEEGSTWLHLSWHEPTDVSLLPDTVPVYNVSVLGNGQATWFTTRGRSYNVTRLKPYCNYTLKVKVKPDISSVWSEPAVISHRTLEDKPGAPQLLNQSGYTWWSLDSITYLTVYWKSIPLNLRNGPLIGYSLCLDCASDALEPLEGSLHTGIVTSVTTSGNSCTWRIQDRNITHRISIRTRNSAGYSDPSTLYIPSYEASQRFQIDFVTVEHISPSSYNISWVTSQPNVQDIAVTWSLGADPLNSTLFGWEEYTVNGSFVIVNMALEALNSRDVSLYFGIALRSGNKSGGITWSPCIFTVSRVDKAPGFSATASGSEVTVKWNFTYCEGEVMKSKPLAYRLLYNNQEASETCSCNEGCVLTVAAYYNVANMTIPNLDPSSTYCVCMRILYKWGEGPLSVPVTVNLRQPHKSPWSLVGLVTAGVLAAVVFITLSVAIVKKTHGRHSNYRPHLKVAGCNCKLTMTVTAEDARTSDALRLLFSPAIPESTEIELGAILPNEGSDSNIRSSRKEARNVTTTL